MEASADILLDAEHLAGLANRLREAGIRASPHQCLLAQQLLIRLIERGELPEKPELLPSLLGPIFCVNPEQQRRFPYVFAKWWEDEFAERLPILDKTPDEEKKVEPIRRRQLRRILAIIFCAILIIGLLVKAWFLWNEWHHQNLRGHVTLPDGSPTNASISFLHQHFESADDGTFAVRFRARDLPLPLVVSKEGFENALLVIRKPIPSELSVHLGRVPSPTSSGVEQKAGVAITGSVGAPLIIVEPFTFHLTTAAGLAGLPLLLAAIFCALLYWYRVRHAPVLER